MTQTQPAPGASVIDATALGRWMDAEQLPGDGAPTLARLSGGSQNELFIVERDGIKAVLRIPPATAGEARFTACGASSRLLRALKGADVPHAEFVAGADDPDGPRRAVLPDAAGRRLVTDGSRRMARAVRVRPGAAPRARLRTGPRRRAAVSKVDWEERGLTGFGRPENFHERQVDRWLSFLGKLPVPRPARPRRGQRLAARPPAAPLGARHHARRLPVRQRHVRPRGPGQAGRGHRLGDDDDRRPAARPGLGADLLAARGRRHDPLREP